MITNNGENLVFIFSLPRSGSTLLSMLLGGHPLVYAPPEPWFLLKLFNITNRADFNSTYDDELATIGAKEFLDAASLNHAISAFALDVYNNKLKTAGKQIFIDKTPRYYHILNEIDSVFPQAKKIWLRRNPLDIAWSYKNTWGIGAEVITGEQYLSHTLDFAVGLFNLCEYFENTAATKMSIKYEDLVNEPDTVIPSLCNFIGVEYDPVMMRFSENSRLLEEHKVAAMGDVNIHTTDSVHKLSVGSGYEKFTDVEIERILQVIGLDIFKSFGYPEVLQYVRDRKLSTVSEEIALYNRQTIIARNVDSLTRLKEELDSCCRERDRYNLLLQAAQASFSWRITKPLRWLADKIRR